MTMNVLETYDAFNVMERLKFLVVGTLPRLPTMTFVTTGRRFSAIVATTGWGLPFLSGNAKGE